MGVNKKFIILFAVFLIIITVLPNIYNKSENLLKEQETKILDTVDKNTEKENDTDTATEIEMEIKPLDNTPDEVTLNVENYDSNSVKISWETVNKLDGYDLYRAKGQENYFDVLLDADKTYYSMYIDKNLDSNTTYYYKIRAYRYVDGEKVYDEYSSTKSIVLQ